MKIDHMSYNVDACKGMDFETFEKMFSHFAGTKTKEHYEIIQKLKSQKDDNATDDTAAETVGSSSDSKPDNGKGTGRVGTGNKRPVGKKTRKG